MWERQSFRKTLSNATKKSEGVGKLKNPEGEKSREPVKNLEDGAESKRGGSSGNGKKLGSRS